MSVVERLRGVSARFGLTYAGGAEPTWKGSVDGVAIQVVAVPGPKASRLCFELALPAARSELLVIDAQHVLSFDEGMRTGDERFDEHTFVRSEEPSVMGCFDGATRVLTTGLTTLGAYVSGGALRLDSDVLDPGQLADIEGIVDQLVRLAKRLALPPGETNEAVVTIARNDPDPEVRAAFTHHLQGSAALRDADRLARVRAESVDEDAALARLAAQLNDPKTGRSVRQEAGMRLLALFPLKRIARALSLIEADLAPVFIERLAQVVRRATGNETAAKSERELAASILIDLATRHTSLDDAAIGNVLAALALAPLPGSFNLILRMCERKNAALRMAALVVLHKLGRPPYEVMRALSPAAKDELQQVLPSFAHKHPTLGASLLIEFFERIEARYVGPRVTYLRAMALTGDTRVGKRLVKELESPYEEVQLAVVEALGHLGDLSVVPALMPLTEGLFRAGSLKTAARTSIEAIRQREGAKSLPGALSLTEGAGPGALELSDEALGPQSDPEQPRHDEE